MSKRKVSVADKIYAVNLYLDGKESQRRIADMFDVSLASVQQWIRNYESMGVNAFTLKGNKKYSKELKQQAVFQFFRYTLLKRQFLPFNRGITYSKAQNKAQKGTFPFEPIHFIS